LLGFDVINIWDNELKEINKDKVGESFRYLNTFLILLGYAKAYFICLIDKQRRYRPRGHAHGKLPSIPDYTTQ
jgi:hypothetical protein